MIVYSINLFRFYELESEAKLEAIFQCRFKDDDYELGDESLMSLHQEEWFTQEGKIFNIDDK